MDRSLEDDDPLPTRAAKEPEAEAEAEAEASTEGGPLKASARLERRTLRAPLASRVVFGLLTAEADAQRGERELPKDLVCVADVSGSMEGVKMDRLREAARFLAEQLHGDDRLALVVFNHEASCVLPLTRVTTQGREAALAAVGGSFAAGGGTSISAGLDKAVALLERRRHRNVVTGVLLLTDGCDCAISDRTLAAQTRRIASAGASLYCLGFGEDHDAALLRRYAEHSRTPFAYVAAPEDLAPAFAGVVGGLAGVAAQHVALRLSPLGGAPLPALRTPFEVLHEDGALEVRIPDVFAGERRDVTLEWTLPADADDEAGRVELPLLAVSLRYFDPHHGLHVVVDDAASLAAIVERAGEEEQPEEEPDLEVAVQRARCESAHALETALELGHTGDVEGARRLLEQHRAQARALLTRGRTVACESLLGDLDRAAEKLGRDGCWTGGAAATLQAAAQCQLLQRHVTVSSSRQDPDASEAQRRWVSRASSTEGA